MMDPLERIELVAGVTEIETDRTPVRWLTYPGDCSDVVGQVVGPEMHGAYFTIVTADYDAVVDKTRAGLAFGVQTRAVG